MISTMEPPEDEFLKDLFHNNPKDYLDMIFAFARMEDAQETQGGPEAEAEEAQAEGQE